MSVRSDKLRNCGEELARGLPLSGEDKGLCSGGIVAQCVLYKDARVTEKGREKQ